MDTTQPQLEPLTRPELALILILAGIQFTSIMDFMILMPLGPQLMRLFEIQPREFGFLVAAYNFAAGLTGFIGAFFLDRFDRKKALSISYVGFTLGTIACGLAPNYITLLLARSLAGLFGGVLGALVMSIVSDAIPASKRGRAMGLVMASFSLASVFGVPFGIFLANHFSWHAPFLFVGGAAFLLSFVIMARIPSMTGHMVSRESRPSPLHVLGRVVSNPNQLRALSLTVLLMLGQFLIIPFMSPSLVDNAGILESELPLMYLVGGGLTIFTSPLVGRLSDRFGRVPLFVIFSALMLFPLYIYTHLGITPLWLVLIISASFFVTSNGRFVPAWTMITSTVQPSARGSFLSLNSSVQSLSGGIASFLASLIVTRTDGKIVNFDKVGYISIVIAIIAIFVGMRLKPVDEKSVGPIMTEAGV